MQRDYDSILHSLQREIRCEGANAEHIDAHLVELFAQPRPELPLDLLRLLDDRADPDGMFALIHAAEAAPLEPYLDALLQALTDLRESAPQWAQIVLNRAINHERAAASLAEKVAVASAAVRSAAAWGCVAIESEGARFPERAAAIRLAAVPS